MCNMYTPLQWQCSRKGEKRMRRPWCASRFVLIVHAVCHMPTLCKVSHANSYAKKFSSCTEKCMGLQMELQWCWEAQWKKNMCSQCVFVLVACLSCPCLSCLLLFTFCIQGAKRAVISSFSMMTWFLQAKDCDCMTCVHVASLVYRCYCITCVLHVLYCFAMSMRYMVVWETIPWHHTWLEVSNAEFVPVWHANYMNTECMGAWCMNAVWIYCHVCDVWVWVGTHMHSVHMSCACMVYCVRVRCVNCAHACWFRTWQPGGYTRFFLALLSLLASPLPTSYLPPYPGVMVCCNPRRQWRKGPLKAAPTPKGPMITGYTWEAHPTTHSHWVEFASCHRVQSELLGRIGIGANIY